MKLTKILPFLAFFFMGTSLMAGEHRAPDSVEGTKNVSLDQAKKLHDAGVIFLDVRGSSAFDKSHIAGAENLNVKGDGFTKDSFAGLVGDKSQEVVIYCNGEKCTRSAMASKKAVKWGYKNVYYFRGGFPDWSNNEYPTE